MKTVSFYLLIYVFILHVSLLIFKCITAFNTRWRSRMPSVLSFTTQNSAERLGFHIYLLVIHQHGQTGFVSSFCSRVVCSRPPPGRLRVLMMSRQRWVEFQGWRAAVCRLYTVSQSNTHVRGRSWMFLFEILLASYLQLWKSQVH